MSAFGFELLEALSTPASCSSSTFDPDENQKVLETSADNSPSEIKGPIHWVELMSIIAELPQDSAPPKPEKMPPQVPEWTKDDVACWLNRTEFEAYINNFLGQGVDGDLLLQLTENELVEDLGMSSGLHRKRFLRELHKLKMSVDYSRIDGTHLEKCVEAEPGTMKSSPMGDIVYISYRNSPGAELASLVKLYLEKYGYPVKMDIDNTEGNDLQASLLRDVASCKHFILILTANSLETDQMHKDLDFAFQFNKNIITVNHKDFKQTTEWPESLRTAFSVNWVHDYQEACIQKIIKCFQEK